MKKLLATLLILVACVDNPRPSYKVIATQKRILKDNVREFTAFRVDKKGWLTSDRYCVYLVDGSVVTLTGKWEFQLTPIKHDDPKDN